VRRQSAWLIVVPLMLAGTEAAHALAYRIVYPQAAMRVQVLAATGHGYASWLTLAAGIGGAIVFIGFLTGAAGAARRQAPRPVPAWAFGLLPLVGFTLQELTERWLVVGGFPWWMVEQPTFRVGLLLQLPFALLAYGVALLLMRAARRLGFAFVAQRPCFVFPSLPARPRLDVAAAVPSGLAGGHAGRGPPAFACAPLPCR
jgi:hypothetical protein